MNFVDRILLQMADAGTRADLVDEISLEQMLGSMYDTSSVPVNGPFNAVFDDFKLGFATVHQCHGKAKLYGGLENSKVLLQLADSQAEAAILVDAMWRGAIIARSTPDDSVIEEVSVRLPALGAIDTAIAADNGGILPADLEVLEQARRTELIQRLQTDLRSPDAITDAVVDQLLGEMGVASVGSLLGSGTGTLGSVTIGFYGVRVAGDAYAAALSVLEAADDVTFVSLANETTVGVSAAGGDPASGLMALKEHVETMSAQGLKRIGVGMVDPTVDKSTTYVAITVAAIGDLRSDSSRMVMVAARGATEDAATASMAAIAGFAPHISMVLKKVRGVSMPLGKQMHFNLDHWSSVRDHT